MWDEILVALMILGWNPILVCHMLFPYRVSMQTILCGFLICGKSSEFPLLLIYYISWISLPLVNALCKGLIIDWRTGRSVLTIIFEMILYIVVQRLIGRKWVDLSGLKFFGISVIRVWFRLLNKWPCLKKVLIASQRFWPIMGQKVWKNETPKSSDPCDLSGFMSNKASLIRHLE